MKKFLVTFLLVPLFSACSHAQSERVTLNGVDLAYEVHGAGPALYMLHGGMESRKSFEAQIPVFAEHFTVVAVDSREQGQSGNAPEQISYDLMAADLIALSAHLGHEKISVMGSSDGAITAMTAALEKPTLIEKLVLLGPNFHYASYPAETREFLATYEWDGNTDETRYPGIFIEHYLTGHNDLSGFGEKLQEMAQMWTNNPTFTVSDLAEITAPTLVINGDREDIPLAHILDLYEAISNAELFIVPDGTHYSLQLKPDLVNSVMLDFLLKD